MATVVRVPKVDMVQENATFVEWLKPEGAVIRKGEPLFVIQTDKANIEVEAPADGTLAGICVEPSDVVPVSQVIAQLLEPGERAPGETGAVQPTRAAKAPALTIPQAVQTPPPTPSTNGGKVRATPVARRLAREMHLDLKTMQGRGPGGRIQKADVYAFLEQAHAKPAPALTARPAIPLPNGTILRRVSLTGPRKIIAERMSYSAATAPHLTVSLRVDMTEALRLQSHVSEHVQAQTGHRLSITAILVRAVAAVLPQHPFLNASLDGEEIVLWGDIDLGIAQSVEDYLIVPVIRHAQSKSLAEIASVLNDLVERGRNKRLLPAEMSGSTFTISNLGMFGIESFTAIINPPEAAILAVGKIVETPVGGEGQMELRPLMQLTLAADHRIVDGAAAARFVQGLKATLENPYLLI